MNDMEYQAGGSDRQLEGLLEHNADRTDLDLADRADVAELRAELARRRAGKNGARMLYE
jgi:hypothetical protein